MATKASTLILNNGITMPAFGLGVFQSGPDETIQAVRAALTDGYRLIDTAAAYGNEQQVGEAVRASEVDRSDIFVTTKLKPADYGFDQALRAFDKSIGNLGLDVLDLYLLHWPVPPKFEDTVASWKAAERLLAEGRVRAIGVCNFRPEDLDALSAESDIVPVVNQVELHPFLVQNALRDVHLKHGIVTQAWSPIGGVNRYWKSGEDPLTDPVIVAIAAQYRKTPAQVILRWHLDRGVSVIPKSVRPERIAENIDVFDFALTDSEIAAINALDAGKRGGPDPAVQYAPKPETA